MARMLYKNSLLVMAALCALFSYSAVAGTFVRPYGSSDYAGGTKAVGTKVNAEFDALKAFLNGGNISSPNIASLGVATGNIADNAVTKAKQERVTIARGGVTVSSTNTTVATTVSNVATITSSGRPILLTLHGQSVLGVAANIALKSNTDAQLYGALLIYRDGTEIYANSFSVGKTAGEANFEVRIPPSAINFVDTIGNGQGPVAGVHTYLLKAYVGSATTTMEFNGAIDLKAIEL